MKKNLKGPMIVAGCVVLVLSVLMIVGCDDLLDMFAEEEALRSWVDDLPETEKGTYSVQFITSHLSLAAATPPYKIVRPPEVKVDALPAEPAWSNHTFIGWYDTTGETGGTRFTADTVVNRSWKLYGRWLYGTPTTVTFNGNGGDPATQTRTVTPPETTVLDWPDDPVKAGPDSFSGWYTEPNGGALFTQGTPVPYSIPITVYAQYGDKYTITFDKNGGETEANPATMSIFGSGTLSVLPAPPTRAGHAFDGWFDTSEDMGGTEFTLLTVISADKTVYARWKLPPAVTFNGNGGIPAIQIKTVDTGAGTALGTLPSTPVRKGYRFKGWFNTSADTGGTQITPATIVNSDMEVYARWDALLIHYFYQQGYVSGGTTQFQDESGGGNPATKAGTINLSYATISGTRHYSAYTNGNGAYFNLGAGVGSIIADLTEEFAVMCYYRIDSGATMTGAGKMLLSFAMSNNLGTDANGGMFLSLKTDRQGWYIGPKHWEGEQGVSVNNGISSEKNAWHHIAYVQSGKTGTTNGKLYVDGTLLKEGPITMLPGDVGNTPYNFIGHSPYSGDSDLTWTRLHDFRLYGKAMSASEISTLANRRSSLPSSWTNQ
jgi:uncharacterized repeat protein (TIGR02543 family)